MHSLHDGLCHQNEIFDLGCEVFEVLGVYGLVGRFLVTKKSSLILAQMVRKYQRQRLVQSHGGRGGHAASTPGSLDLPAPDRVLLSTGQDNGRSSRVVGDSRGGRRANCSRHGRSRKDRSSGSADSRNRSGRPKRRNRRSDWSRRYGGRRTSPVSLSSVSRDLVTSGVSRNGLSGNRSRTSRSRGNSGKSRNRFDDRSSSRSNSGKS